MHLNLRGRHAARERDRQLACRGDVAAKALLGEERANGGAGEGLRGEDQFEVIGLGGEGGLKALRAGAHVIFGDDVGRRSELARQFNNIAAADLEPSKLVDRAPDWVDVLEWLRFSHRRESCHSAQAK